MKKVVISIMMALFVLFAAAGAVSAEGETSTQAPQNQISITDVEKLIDQKMSKEKPLSEEELTKALLDMKDEKIANLDGNVSKTIDLFAAFLGIAALLLAALTGIIGWFFKRNVDDKLAKIEATEDNVNKKHTEILAKAASVEEHYKEFRKFRDDLEKFNKRLDDISQEIAELRTNFDGLGDYVQTIEDITNATVLMIQFINQRYEAVRIVREAKESISQPQKHLQHTLIRLTKKLGGIFQFNNMYEVAEHLDYLIHSLLQEESNVLEKIENYRGVQTEHEERDESTMRYNEEVNGIYEDWKGYLEEIKAMNEVWKAQLSLNPVNPPADTEPSSESEGNQGPG